MNLKSICIKIDFYLILFVLGERILMSLNKMVRDFIKTIFCDYLETIQHVQHTNYSFLSSINFIYGIDIDEVRKDFKNENFKNLDKYTEIISYENNQDYGMKRHLDDCMKVMLSHLNGEYSINSYIKLCLKYGVEVDKYPDAQSRDTISFLENNIESHKLIKKKYREKWKYYDFVGRYV